MYQASAYAAAGATSSLARTTIQRRDPSDRDVQIEILYRGICHSDLHVVSAKKIQKVSEAYERLLGANVRYRSSIDMASLKAE